MFQSIYHLKLSELHAGRKQLRGFQTSVPWCVEWPGWGQMVPFQLELLFQGEPWACWRSSAAGLGPSWSAWAPPDNSRVGTFAGLLLPGCQQRCRAQINPFPEVPAHPWRANTAHKVSSRLRCLLWLPVQACNCAVVIMTNISYFT